MVGIYKYTQKEPRGGNPVVRACYWKEVLHDHIEDVLGCSVSRFKDKCREAVSTVRKCAGHLDEITRDAGKAKMVGSTALIAGSAMAIGGAAAAPFTGGLSLPLTLGGTGIAGAGGVVNAGSELVKYGWRKSDTENAKRATCNVIDSIRHFRELLTIYSHHFQEAQKFIKTSEGEAFVRKLKSAVRNDDTFSKSDKKELVKVLGSLVKGAGSFGMAAYRTLGVVEFISTGTYARAGLQTALAVQKSSMGVALDGKYIVMVGSTGAKMWSVGIGILGIGMGILDAIDAADAINNGSELARKMYKFASDIESSMEELLHTYSKAN